MVPTARDTSRYIRIQLPTAGPEVMLPPRIDKKTGLPIKPLRFPRSRKLGAEGQSICDYYWDGPSRP